MSSGRSEIFLKKDYLNFITVDLICHGVPSIRSLKDSLSHYIKGLDFETISYLSFRNHEKGDFCLECKGKTKNRIPFEFEKGIDYSTSYYPAFSSVIHIVIVVISVNMLNPKECQI